MKDRARFADGSVFFVVVAAVASCLLASPLQVSAQNCSESQGNNAVYNATNCNNGNPVVVGSSSFIDASMFAQSGSNFCQVLNGILSGTSTPYPATGAVIDARGLANSTPPTSMTCTTTNPSPWAGITNPPPSTILLPATGGTSPNPIIIPSTWALPPNTRLVGEGDGIPSTTSPGTTIRAASGFASGTAMISFGLSSLCTAGCTGISAEKLTLDGHGQSINGIGNGFSQSLSYVDHVSLYRILLYT